MLANLDGKYYFGDSMGKPLENYQYIKIGFTPRRMVWQKMQRGGLCGLYSIYFAHKLFNDKNLNSIKDFDVVKFFSIYL